MKNIKLPLTEQAFWMLSVNELGYQLKTVLGLSDREATRLRASEIEALLTSPEDVRTALINKIKEGH